MQLFPLKGHLAIPSAVAACLIAGSVEATQLLQVRPQSKADLLRLAEYAPESRTCGATLKGDLIEFPAEEQRAEELRAAGFEVTIAVDNLEAFYQDRLHSDGLGGGPFGDYHTYTEAIAAMDALAAANPGLMTARQSIGNTLEGRPMYVYKISDNPNVDEDEPEIFFNAYIHAREAITFEVVYDLAQWLLSNYGTVDRAGEIVNDREIWILPVVNPDGVEYNAATSPSGGGMWRKNRRNNGGGTFGVDLNRNLGFNWGFDNSGSSPDPSSDTYRGPSAFSELETQAYRDFVASRHFNMVLDYHSYSNLHLCAFGYDNIHPLDYEAMFSLGQLRKSGNNYAVGTTWELLYPVNGSTGDWLLGDVVTKPKIMSFVTEVGTGGDGFWPLESRIPALVSENREANLRMCEYADNPYRALSPNVGVVTSTDTVGTTFTLTFETPNPDPDNPAVKWNLLRGTSVATGVDDVEGTTPSRWTADGWATSVTRAHSATHSWWAGQADYSNHVLVSKRAHKVTVGESLVYWTWHNIESGWDYGYVEVSTDGRTYTPIAGTYTTNSDPNGHNLGNGITGNSSGWKQATHSLAAYTGQTIWIRFRYNTDAGQANAGWYVDDISPTDLFANETVLATDIVGSQYTLTDHPEGSFAFAVQAVDAEGNSSAWGTARTVLVQAGTTAVDGPLADVAWRGLEFASSNPVATSALLRFAVPADARTGEKIRLSIYDVNGREVASLLEGEVGQGNMGRGSAGNGGGSLLSGNPVEVRWDATRQNAGIYFARLQSGARISEARIVVLH
ncbi:MAG: immune inhibitor A [Candidatus Eisenbacteria bacterium]|nr:immune inhibitor A [Candidatus Eisenbacteria bacterium]